MGYTRRSSTIVCIFFLLSSMTVSSVFGATKHGCAPSTPPPVAGTLAQPEATVHVVFINEVLSNPDLIWNCSDEGASQHRTRPGLSFIIRKSRRLTSIRSIVASIADPIPLHSTCLLVLLLLPMVFLSFFLHYRYSRSSLHLLAHRSCACLSMAQW